MLTLPLSSFLLRRQVSSEQARSTSLAILVRLAVSFTATIGCTSAATAETRVGMVLDNYGGAVFTQPLAERLPRLAAEFEPARALMLSVGDWQPHHRAILQQIARKTSDHLPLCVLCGDTVQMKTLTGWLRETGVRYDHVYFCVMPTDTIWLRDFGPIFLETVSAPQVLDFFYVGSRPLDDGLAKLWATRTQSRHVEIKWTLQGGNLISNGQGIALTTHRIFEDNYIRFPDVRPDQDVERDRRQLVGEAIVGACNLKQLVVLEPLESEATKHVDMFCSFVSPRDVVVAQLDRAADPLNAAILERNAYRLGQVRVDGQPLRVHRVTIPARVGEAWSTYTNAVLAGDLVLLPVLDSDPQYLVQNAQTTYQELLPGRMIETIDMSSMRQLQGELHCLSLQVPMFAPMPPVVYSFNSAEKFYFAQQQ